MFVYLFIFLDWEAAALKGFADLGRELFVRNSADHLNNDSPGSKASCEEIQMFFFFLALMDC